MSASILSGQSPALFGVLNARAVAELGRRGVPPVLDMTRVSFATVDGIVALAALLHAWASAGFAVVVDGPLDVSVRNYMSRAHFGRFLDFLGWQHDFPVVRERDLGNSIVPLTRLESSTDATALATAVVDFAERHSTRAADPLGAAICEAGENVGFHSGQKFGFGLAQYYPARRRFEFALGDGGRGLLASLQHVGAEDHHSAILLALTPGVSASTDAGRGYGLSSVEQYIVVDLAGTLSLLSGEGMVDARPEIGRVKRSVSGEFPGTVVFGGFTV